MIMIAIYSLIYLYIIFFELLPIKENNYDILFKFNLIVICISFFIVILVGLGFKVASPSNFIEHIVKLFIS